MQRRPRGVSQAFRDEEIHGEYEESKDDEWDDDYDVPPEHRNRNRTISKSIMKKLEGISKTRKDRCITIFRVLSYIDYHKINFRLFNPRGERAGARHQLRANCTTAVPLRRSCGAIPARRAPGRGATERSRGLTSDK